MIIKVPFRNHDHQAWLVIRNKKRLFQAINVGDLSDPELKLGWIFTAFDADGGGSIDADEIRY